MQSCKWDIFTLFKLASGACSVQKAAVRTRKDGAGSLQLNVGLSFLQVVKALQQVSTVEAAPSRMSVPNVPNNYRKSQSSLFVRKPDTDGKTEHAGALCSLQLLITASVAERMACTRGRRSR